MRTRSMPGRRAPAAARLAAAALLALALPCGAATVLINEVQTTAPGNVDHEFIELFNATGATSYIGGWTLRYAGTAGTPVSTPLYTFAAGEFLVANSHFLLVRAGQDFGVVRDGSFVQPLSETGGGLGLFDAEGHLVDAVSWGHSISPNAFAEGTPAVAPPPGASIERTPMAMDTNDNQADFAVQAVPVLTRRIPDPATAWLVAAALACLALARRRAPALRMPAAR